MYMCYNTTYDKAIVDSKLHPGATT